MIHQERRSYDLNGVTVSVFAAEPVAAAFLDPLLAALSSHDHPRPDWTISVTHTDRIEEPPAGVSLLWDEPLPEGIPSWSYLDGARRVIASPGHFTMTSRRSDNTTAIEVIPGSEHTLGGSAVFWLLDDILAARGQHLLHGACLIDESADEAFALFAPSGTGKTTTALALARNGLGLAGDDALVLTNVAAASYLWGIPRYTKIHRKTVALLPWLGPHIPLTDADEEAVPLDALASVIALGSAVSRRAAAAIILRKPNATGHQVSRLSKAEATSLIVSDNIRRSPQGVDIAGQASFAAVARFLAQTPTVALSAGPDPSTLHIGLIRDAL